MIDTVKRTPQIEGFLSAYFKDTKYTYEAITSDASFRQYYRVLTETDSFILMDSPPSKVNNMAFIQASKSFQSVGLKVPDIFFLNEQEGLLLLNDLGQVHLANRLSLPSKLQDYEEVIDLIPQIAATKRSPWMNPYDADFIDAEMEIFAQWLLTEWLGGSFAQHELEHWQDVKAVLVKNMLTQPQVTMHRDFHSRNIMHSGSWALIDYQDAVQGPVCYDLVSLLRDCYVILPEAEFAHLYDYGYQTLKDAQLINGVSQAQFKTFFDLTGMQRHLKAAGIFCRLYLRDGKSGYLSNILPTLQYVVDVAGQYEQFQWLATWLQADIMPQVVEKIGGV